MSNAASLFLPGSNLTNLIIAARRARLGRRVLRAHVGGGDRRRRGHRSSSSPGLPARARAGGDAGRRARVGAARSRHRRGRRVDDVGARRSRAPALPVLVVGVAAVLVDRVGRARIHADRRRARARPASSSLAVALGAVGRWWSGPASLLDHLGRVGDGARRRGGGRVPQQPAGGRPAHAARAAASARAADRPEPRPEPRGDGLALGLLLAACREVASARARRCAPTRRWASCSCRCRSAPRSARSGWSRRAASEPAALRRSRVSGTGR